MNFRVIKTIDGDTIEVTPNWNWSNQNGSVVRPLGYDTPEMGQPGYQTAKDKLARLVLGKYVELKDAVNITYGRLLCDVYYNGKKLADYFAEY